MQIEKKEKQYKTFSEILEILNFKGLNRRTVTILEKRQNPGKWYYLVSQRDGTNLNRVTWGQFLVENYFE